MAALGMDAVVIPVCLLVPQEAGDEALFAAFETLLRRRRRSGSASTSVRFRIIGSFLRSCSGAWHILPGSVSRS